ncbi:metallophosphoesterase [Chakrabartyella piscis]|uniref:metallophosphoesterase family protein n=1 Tax=Chakrabartyella piscis TaxID=2918914 RepID=UPI0029584A90|nr:metallophosphoesterase [Chakrabartyella piscis]
MTGRILVTGDMHGTFSHLFYLAETKELFDTDILLIAGDAGYVWDANYGYKIATLQQIFPGIIAFVDGNHENHDLLNAMEVCTWNGSKAHRIGERVYHLMRGEVYSIYEKQFFVFGGARSVDKDRREEGISWWKAEEPTLAEIAYGAQQLQAFGNEIDYIITHEPPLFARGCIARDKPMDADYMFPKNLDEWYRFIEQFPRFQKWYFGHMHVDQKITSKLEGVYTSVVEII